ncbi:hypothetical protein GKC30_11710 [Pseudodesulfovibrio sp. F-1]|uniref:Uncharacterized protein n=1 Tax=Pseudodesulfovibrio alkaliphilus TaxID=2661613 RepID=A0A7K1KR23_9BACT|nr:hypothetical protein [Pseudodesulfovibrio alkaliphilus]MUM78301.1 hypothetical protein [Pseudodesulfovibrio alkaliphilus]
MGLENGKVHKLERVNADETPVVDEEVCAGSVEAHNDMSKVAMIVSLLAVLLLVIFFFGMNRNIAGLSDEVKNLGSLRDEVSSLDQRMIQMQADVPVHIKRMIAHDMVNEMAMKAAYLGETLDSESQRAAMQLILKELQGVRAGLEK